MTKFFTINDYKDIINYYHLSMPKNIYNIKKKANNLLVYKMCQTNFNENKKFMIICLIIKNKRILSNNCKKRLYKTMKNVNKKRKYRVMDPTRMTKPFMNYLCI
jgi:hypothetical protein